MAKNQDLVVKMTINSTDFDAGLQNAKKSMKGMQDQTVTLGSVFKRKAEYKNVIYRTI